MPKRNLSIQKNSRSNKNKNKIPKKSKKPVIKNGVKGKKGVKATKKRVKNKKKTQKGGSGTKQKLLKKPTTKLTSITKGTGLATNLNKLIRAQGIPRTLPKRSALRTQQKQIIRMVNELQNSIYEPSSPETVDELLKTALRDMEQLIPTDNELFKIRYALLTKRRTISLDEYNAIKKFFPYLHVQQHKLDTTDENLITNIRALATKRWDPSTKYTNVTTPSGAVKILQNSYKYLTPEIKGKWAQIYRDSGGNNGDENSGITLQDAMGIIDSSLNYNKIGQKTWSYIRGHYISSTTIGGAKKNLVGGAACTKANSLEHLLAYLVGLFCGVLASKKLEEIYKNYFAMVFGAYTDQYNTHVNLISLISLFLHPRECEDTNSAKNDQPLIQASIIPKSDKSPLAQFTLVDEIYFKSRGDGEIKTSGSIGWWGLKDEFDNDVDGGWYGKKGEEQISRDRVRKNQKAYIEATLGTVNFLLDRYPELSTFFIVFWLSINEKNPIPLSPTNLGFNQSQIINKPGLNAAVAQAGMNIQQGTNEVTEENVNDWFSKAAKEKMEVEEGGEGEGGEEEGKMIE